MNHEQGSSEDRFIRSTRPERALAVVLLMIYLGGWALAVYAGSHRIEDDWSARLYWSVATAWFVVMLVLPVAIVCPALLRSRMSLRTLMVFVPLVAAVLELIRTTVK